MVSLRQFDLLPVQIGLSIDGKASYKTTLGGLFTLIIVVLSIIYAIIMLIEPLSVKNTSINITSSSNSGMTGNTSSAYYDTISDNSAGAKLQDTVILDGIEFEGTQEVKQYTHYIDNYTYSKTPSFYPHQAGFQFAIKIPEDYDDSALLFEIFRVSYAEGQPNFTFIEWEL